VSETTKYASYIRVSTEEQAEKGTSIDHQRESIEGWLKALGFSLFQHYVDDGYSGGNMDRPALQRMLRDAEHGLFQGVVVHKTDRLSRNIKDIVKIALDVLDSHRVIFRSVQEPYDTSTPMGKMLFTLLGSFADFERATITERGLSGKRRKAMQGEFMGGHTLPFGYTAISKRAGGLGKITVSPREKGILLSMIEWLCHEHLSTFKMANRLNADLGRYPPKYGRKWYRSTVYRILTNPACCGEFTYSGQPYQVEPLIDKATFQRVQEALRANQRRTQGHPKREYLLRGFLKCKRCETSIGGGYHRSCYRRKDGSLWTRGYRLYACTGYQNRYDTALQRRCPLGYINGDALETAVWAEIEKLLTDPDFLRQTLAVKVEETLKDCPSLETQLSQLNGQIAEAEEKERRALELALSLKGIPTDMLKEMLREIQQDKRTRQAERDQLKARMAELEAEVDRLRNIDGQMSAIITAVQAHAYDQDRRTILELLIERIWVDYDEGTGHYSAEIEGILPASDLLSPVSTAVTVIESTRNTAPRVANMTTFRFGRMVFAPHSTTVAQTIWNAKSRCYLTHAAQPIPPYSGSMKMASQLHILFYAGLRGLFFTNAP
jgi:site-specific DNA recombinase